VADPAVKTALRAVVLLGVRHERRPKWVTVFIEQGNEKRTEINGTL
jgi:hypothetical protein